MQVNAISLSSPSFRATEEERAFAALDDSVIRAIAWNKASAEVDDKRHNRLDRAMYYSLPLIGGISTLAQKMDSIPYKAGLMPVPSHKIRSAKLGRAGMVAGAWAIALGAVGALWGAKDIAEKISKPIRDFNKEHPVFSTLATLTASLGAIVLANRFSGKIVEKFVLKDGRELIRDLSKVTKLDNALNNSKILNTADNFIKKMPSALKDIGKTVVDFLPWIAIGTQIAHSWGHQNVKLAQVDKDYKELKAAQDLIRQDILDEEIDKNIGK